MGMKVGYNTVWSHPELAETMRNNTAEAAAQDEHALEDELAARRRAPKRRRRSPIRRLISRVRGR